MPADVECLRPRSDERVGSLLTSGCVCDLRRRRVRMSQRLQFAGVFAAALWWGSESSQMLWKHHPCLCPLLQECLQLYRKLLIDERVWVLVE
eukprot:1353154-Amphidinium_carterae.2